jgi:ABC-type branched-subunit amino acid transport system substrate-binding protein
MQRLTRVTAAVASLCGALMLGGCAALPGNAAPVVKIGVIAPFEGAGRPLGYAVLPAIKAAVADANAQGSFGPSRAMVVAFNDNLDPATAAEQAQALALDRDVVAVIGPFTQETADAARPILEAAGLRFEPVISADPLDEDYSEEIGAAADAIRAILR